MAMTMAMMMMTTTTTTNKDLRSRRKERPDERKRLESADLSSSSSLGEVSGLDVHHQEMSWTAFREHVGVLAEPVSSAQTPDPRRRQQSQDD
jgi:hypothetical protein